MRDEPLQRGTTSEVRSRERERIAPHLRGFQVVALDSAGVQRSSEELAFLLDRLETTPPQKTAFVIGGAVGLDPSIVSTAAETLSLGPITLPHQLARVVLVEQLFRAMTILRGHPYHN